MTDESMSYLEALKEIKRLKEALEQQPCEDCISRQAVINAINQNCIYENEYNLTASHIKEMVQQLPSVTQKEKTGHLIDDGFASESNWIFDRKTYRCSSCKFPTYIKYDYCPNCGARMVSE